MSQWTNSIGRNHSKGIEIELNACSAYTRKWSLRRFPKFILSVDDYSLSNITGSRLLLDADFNVPIKGVEKSK